MNEFGKYNEIFQRLGSKIGKSEIRDINEMGAFLKMLIDETRGLVIVDFLDAANWDYITSFQIDEEKNHLYLYWRVYRDAEESENEKELRSLLFSASLYGLFMSFQSLTVVDLKRFPVFLLQGYTLSDKDIKKALSPGSEEFEVFKDNYFNKVVVRKVDGQWQHFTCLNTPLYSAIFVPKRSGLGAGDSRYLLYGINVETNLKRLKSTNDELALIKAEDFDQISEKANTIRRRLENTLKIECCFRDIVFKQSYAQQLLGDLINAVKDTYEEADRAKLNKMVRLANELSHDTGLPIKKSEA